VDIDLSQLNRNVALGFEDIVLGIMLSALSAYIIRIIYIRYASTLNNKNYFSTNFVLLSVITCVVIMVVKNSLALSLGLVGALSIVRFRTAVKEPEELVYLFLVIALGLAYGSNQYMLGFITVVMSWLIIWISQSFFLKQAFEKENTAYLIVEGDSKNYIDWSARHIDSIKQYTDMFSIKEIDSDNGKVNTIYHLIVKDDFKVLEDQILNHSKKFNLKMTLSSNFDLAE